MNTIPGSYFHFAFGHKVDEKDFLWSYKLLDLTLFSDTNQEVFFYKIGKNKMQRNNDICKIFEEFIIDYKKINPNELLSNDVLSKLLNNSFYQKTLDTISIPPSYKVNSITNFDEDIYEFDTRFDGELFIEKNALINIEFSFDSNNVFFDNQIILNETDKESTLDSELSFLSEYETTYSILTKTN